MKLDINYKEMDSTEAIKNFIEEKAQKLEDFVAADEHIRIVVGAKFKGQQHHAEIYWHCNLLAKDFHSQAEGHDLYAQIDEAFEKVLKQVHQAKDKMIDAKRRGTPPKKMPLE